VRASYEGNASFPFTIQDLRIETLKLRIASLKAKQDSLQAYLDRVKPIEELFKREGITYSEM
jgi:hypothetical protein